jgi:tape measure domain-containing protein
MATSSQRESSLKVSVSTSGSDSLKTLRGEVAGLAKDGGEAAPVFARIGDELDKLAAQQNAIDTFATLKRETVDLGVSLTQAAVDVDRLGTVLPEVAASTRTFVQAQNEAKASLDANRTLLTEARDALSQLKSEYTGAARATDEYKVQSGELKATIAQLRTNVAEAKTEFVGASAAAKDAAQAEKTLTAEFNASLNTAKQLSGELATRNSVLESSRASLAANGIETTKLNEAQTKLRSTLAGITAEIEQQTAATGGARAAQQAFEAIANDVAQALEREQAAAGRAAQSYTEQQAAIAAVAKVTADYLAEQQALADKTALAATAQAELVAANERAAASWQANAEAIVGSKLAVEGQITETAKLIAVQQELIAQKVFEQTAAEAKKLVDAGNYVRFWQDALNDVDATQKRVAESSRAAAVALDDAFSKTGVRSTQAIQTEIQQINESLIKLASNSRVSGSDFDRAFTTAQQRVAALTNELNGVPAKIDQTSSSLGYLKQQFSQLAAIYGGIQLGQAFIDANVQIETLRRTLTFVTGSTAEAAKQLQLLRDTANSTGVSVSSIADSFVRFNASASQAGISSQVVRDLFTGVSAAAGKMGLSSDRVALSLEAISQIAGKGVVSMEELRGQLGDSLPGAMNIAARSVGLTVAQFTKLVATGQVLAEDFLPQFAAEFKKTFGDGTTQVEGFIQSFNRLKNALSEVAQRASDSTTFKALASTMDFLAKNMNTVVDATYALGKAFIALKAIQIVGEFTGITAALQSNAIAQERNALAVTERAAVQAKATITQEAATIATASNTVALEINAVAVKSSALAWGTMEGNLARSAVAGSAAVASQGAIATAASAAGKAIGAVSAIVGGLPGLLVATIVSGKELGTWIGEGIADLAGYGKQLKDNEAKLKAQDEALRKAGEAAKSVGPQWLQIAQAYSTSTAAGEKNILVQEKLAQTAAQVAETSTRIAALSGNEAEARTVAATAALNLVSAYSRVQVAQQTQLDLLVSERAALIAAAGGEDKLTEAKKLALITLDEKINKARAETEASIAATQAAKEEAAAKTLTVQTNLDNSASLAALKEAYEQAKINALAFQSALRDGIGTQAAADDATRKAAVAERLYIDALGDSVKAIERRAAVQQASITQQQAESNLSQQVAVTAQRQAEAVGNVVAATQAKIAQKSAEIDATNLTAKALENEANTTIALTNAKKEELEASGALTADAQAGIDASLASAKAKLTEAAAIKEKVKQLEIEITTQREQAEGSKTAGSASGSFDDRNAQIDKDQASAAARAASDSAQLGQSATDYLNSPSVILANKRKAGTLTADDSGLAQTNFNAASANLLVAQKNMTQFSAEGYQSVLADYRQAQQVLDAVKALSKASGTSGGTSHTVTVNIGGKATTINAATANDASQLANLLKQLDSAAQTASP